MIRSSVVLAVVAALGLLHVAQCADSDTHVEIVTLGPNEYAKLEKAASWDWTRDKNGDYDMTQNMRYIMTKYFHIEEALDKMCTQFGLDTCQPYFQAMRKDLQKTLDAATDAVLFFDHYVLKTRKEHQKHKGGLHKIIAPRRNVLKKL